MYLLYSLRGWDLIPRIPPQTLLTTRPVLWYHTFADPRRTLCQHR